MASRIFKKNTIRSALLQYLHINHISSFTVQFVPSKSY